MTLAQLQALFRQKIKQATGGPTDITRGAGVIACLDALAGEIQALKDSAAAPATTTTTTPTPTATYTPTGSESATYTSATAA